MKAKLTFFLLLSSLLLISCKDNKPEVWAWIAGKTTMTDQEWDSYFSHAKEVGIDAILVECHGGYPEVLTDSSDMEDKAAVLILENAAKAAKKYGIALHAWMWTTNRCEHSTRDAHPEWYQVNRLGMNMTDFKMYNREHYRFLCPSHKEAIEYLKERVREIAAVDGLAGIHMDFIRYPDAMLPYGLHESRGVVQDKFYPMWDCCYCEECRAAFKKLTGIDPLELEDPATDPDWLAFRWNAMANFASEIAAEIKACGKVSSAAVFASPEESRKLVRQDWTHFKNVDIFLPMIYNDAYGFPNEWIETATREGVAELDNLANPAILRSGMAFGRNTTEEELTECFRYALNGGSDGVCIFCLEPFQQSEGGWERLGQALHEAGLN